METCNWEASGARTAGCARSTCPADEYHSIPILQPVSAVKMAGAIVAVYRHGPFSTLCLLT